MAMETEKEKVKEKEKEMEQAVGLHWESSARLLYVHPCGTPAERG